MLPCEGFRKQHFNCALLTQASPAYAQRVRSTTDQGKKDSLLQAAGGMGSKKQKKAASKSGTRMVDVRNISNGHGSKHRCWGQSSSEALQNRPAKSSNSMAKRPYVTSVAVNDDGRREWRREERHARVPRPIYRRRVVAVERHRHSGRTRRPKVGASRMPRTRAGEDQQTMLLRRFNTLEPLARGLPQLVGTRSTMLWNSPSGRIQAGRARIGAWGRYGMKSGQTMGTQGQGTRNMSRW